MKAMKQGGCLHLQQYYSRNLIPTLLMAILHYNKLYLTEVGIKCPLV